MTADALSRLLDDAVRGRLAPLEDWLARSSRLPGPRANDALAVAFAQLCRERGERADGVAIALARRDAEQAPGATAYEFLPVCGVAALGARAAADPGARGALIGELHAHADDLRFRVRDAVVQALSVAGGGAGEALLEAVAMWMDGYFHAAAVVRAMTRDPWLGALADAKIPVARLGEAFDLAHAAPRAAARYPGRKALVDALPPAAAALALKFGSPAIELVVTWAKTKDPELREVAESVLGEKRLNARFPDEIRRLRLALHAAAGPVRNPDHDVGRTRDRSGARRGRRRGA